MTTSWQIKHSDLKSRVAYLFETKSQSDCSFLFCEGNGSVVEAHKVIVSSASAVLQVKLGTAEGDHPRVTISDVEPEIFELMLKYIYTDSVAIGSSEEAFKLACAAGIYELPHLKNECFKHIATTNITPQNVLQTYDLASCYKDSDLFRKCEEIIKTKTKEVLEDNSFLEACMYVVSAVFGMEPLAINSELELLQAADRYHKHLVEKEKIDDKCYKEILFEKVVSKIRFLTLNPQEFAEARASSSLLAETDACAVLANIESDKSIIPMPKGLSVSRKARNMANIFVISAITMEFHVPLVTDKTWFSPTFYVQNLPWRVKVGPCKKHPSKHVYIRVHCNWDSQMDDWACSPELQLSLLRGNLEPLSYTFTKTFDKDHVSWGKSSFMNYEDLLDPENKYLQDGVMVLVVSIKAEKPTIKAPENLVFSS